MDNRKDYPSGMTLTFEQTNIAGQVTDLLSAAKLGGCSFQINRRADGDVSIVVKFIGTKGTHTDEATIEIKASAGHFDLSADDNHV